MMRKLQTAQCQAITKKGRRCAIDSDSKMKNERGKLVGEPLLHGSRFCLIHAQIFQYEPAIITSPTLIYKIYILLSKGRKTGGDFWFKV